MQILLVPLLLLLPTIVSAFHSHCHPTRPTQHWRVYANKDSVSTTKVSTTVTTTKEVSLTTTTAPSSPSSDSTLLEKLWYNCNQVTKACLGNALDDENYRKGVLAVAGLTFIFSSNSPALHALYVSVKHPPPVSKGFSFFFFNKNSSTTASFNKYHINM